MEFWAFSTYGDSSQPFTALIQVTVLQPEGETPARLVCDRTEQPVGGIADRHLR